MTAPIIHPLILPPPDISRFGDNREMYKHFYEIWKRTGGYTSQIPDLRGLAVSVNELNTLTGIRTDDTVQQQLNQKINRTELGSMAYQNSDNVDISGGTIDDVNIDNANIDASSVTDSTITDSTFTDGTIDNAILENSSAKVGNSNEKARLGGTVYIDTTIISNVLPGSILMSYDTPANSLYEVGEYFEITAFGKFTSDVVNKELSLGYGGTVLLTTGSLPFTGGYWRIKATIMNQGSNKQICSTDIITSNTDLVATTKAIITVRDTSIINTISFLAESNSSGVIVQEGMIVKWFEK